VFRIRDRGIPRGGGARGDQRVRIIVEVPTGLTPRQQELLEEFAKSSGQEVHPMSRGFFDKVKEMFG
jgi:molecular chaperone DnaJ